MRTIRDATAASSRDDCFDRRRRRRASRARRRARDRTRRAIGRAQSDAAVGMTSNFVATAVDDRAFARRAKPRAL